MVPDSSHGGPPGSPAPGAGPAPADLATRLAAGEESAYEELVRSHGPRMLALAERYLPRGSEAEDAVQDALVCVVRFIHGYDGASRLETWLHRIVVNSCLMILRRRRRHPAQELTDAALEAGPAAPSGRWSPPSAERLAADEEMRLCVRRGLDALPEAQRVILLLRDVDGFELKAIAQMLGIGLSTAKMRLYGARTALQTLLGPRLTELSS